MAFDYSKGIDRSAPFNRTSAFPLDQQCYFESLASAKTAAESARAAGDTSTTYYYGQTVTVVENDAVTNYKIVKMTNTLDITFTKEGVTKNYRIYDVTFASAVATATALDKDTGTTTTVTSEENELYLLDVKVATNVISADVSQWQATAASTLTVVANGGKLVSLEQAAEIGEEVLTKAKAYADSKVSALDKADTAVENQFVTAVSETDGIISVTRAALQTADLPPVTLEKLTNSGTLKKIPADYLPGYVDDIVQFVITTDPPSSPAEGDVYYNNETKKLYQCKTAGAWTEVTPESTKIYVSKDDGKAYRWSGSDMVVIASNLALGETETTAYRGDRGKIAYDHSQDSARVTTAVASGFYKIAVTAQGHIASTTAVTASDIPVDAYQFADGTNKFSVTKPDGTTVDVNVTPHIENATQSDDGLMSSEDKTKLDGVTTGANKVEASTTNGNIKIDGAETTVYTHPAYTATDPAAKKVGLDATGHVVLGDALAKGDVGLGNVNNTSLTVSATDGVTDNTNNVTYKYTHPTYTEATAAAVKVGRDASGHVEIGGALTSADVGLGLVVNQAVTVTSTSVSATDGTTTTTFNKYVHPTGAQAAIAKANAVAAKVACDGDGHIIVGDGLTKGDVGLDKVANQTITVTSTSVSASDGTTTTTFNQYVHPTTTAVDAAAKKVGKDSTGHVVLGDALTGADVGVSATTHSVTVDGTTFSHEYDETPVAAAAVKVGYDAKKHVVLGAALTGADVGVTATTTSVTVDGTTFNQYVHPTTTAVDAAAVKVGKDGTGHVVLGDALAVADISGLQTALDAKQDNLSFTGTYNASTNPVALKDYVDAVETELTTLKDVQTSGSTNVVASVTVNTDGKLSVTKGTVAETDLDQALKTKINNATSALHFIGVVAAIDIEHGKYKTSASAEEWTDAKSGDVVLYGQKEYVCYTDTTVTPSQNKFAELGDESLYLTKTEAASTYETITNCNTIRDRLDALEADTHTHDNKATLDAITSSVKDGYDAAVTKVAGIASGATKVVDGDNNGEIKVTKVSNGSETTETITVYDDTSVKADISANTASITALSAAKANKVTVNTSDSNAAFKKVNVNSEGIVAGTASVTKSDVTTLVGAVTTTTDDLGMMTAADKTKLDGIATGAEVNTVEGAVDANGVAFTIDANKMIVIDQIILDGGSATSVIS